MKRYAKLGAIYGSLIGIITFIGYTIASWWVCTTILDCPGHWIPYLIIFIIGVAVFTIIGITLAVLLRSLYNITRVDN